jgi:Leu/Phe-tRNA-protein transferase
MKWWRPLARAVLASDELRIDRKTRRALRQAKFLR